MQEQTITLADPRYAVWLIMGAVLFMERAGDPDMRSRMLDDVLPELAKAGGDVGRAFVEEIYRGV